MHTAAHRPILTRLALAAALLSLPACGARPSLRADAPPAQVVELEPTIIEASVDGQGGLALDAIDAETLFTRAKDAFDSQRFDEAERLFGKLLDAVGLAEQLEELAPEARAGRVDP
jgi:hypothetical protein